MRPVTVQNSSRASPSLRGSMLRLRRLKVGDLLKYGNLSGATRRKNYNCDKVRMEAEGEGLRK